MLERLRTALPEITWDRDAVSEDAGVNCGAVELTGSRQLYADGKVIDQIHRIDVWICVNDSGTDWQGRIQAVLESMDENDDFAWGRPERRYAANIDQVIWRWRCESLGLEPGTKRRHRPRKRRPSDGEV